MERVPLGQNLSFSPQGYTQLRSTELQYMNSQSAPTIQYVPSPEYFEAKRQLERWANWVKFVSIFIIVKSLISVISLAFTAFFASKSGNPDKEYMIYSSIAVAYFLLTGLIGYKAGSSKSSSAAKCYIFMLLTIVLVEAALLIIILPYIINKACNPYGGNDNDYTSQFKVDIECDENAINIAYIASIITFVIICLLVCTPMLWCPCKLNKYSAIVEKGTTLVPIQVQAPAQPIYFNPVLGQQFIFIFIKCIKLYIQFCQQIL
ncbi:hypothetical protein SteCoe_25685 [Stentor coeruleus]|uniref:Transmembrane protein n=1 Tax=Stentor coeruleus TaxID=5963 RepID=A0A1R2BER8_9CILI|nr:hypothetical protein SteCoe_25685 [Stentor coeruleus]